MIPSPDHLLVLPVAIPLLTGALLLIFARWPLVVRRAISGVAAVLLALIAIQLLMMSGDDAVRVYLLGDWAAPFGILLVLDRLSALMLVLTALLALFALAYAVQEADSDGHNFHALFQFQLLGLNGAFLTGDLFNLFVFFEILLLASYGLLLHGGGAERTRAGLHYVVLNLIGSSFFLIAAGLLYSVTGTLNMADLAVQMRALPAEDLPIAAAGGLLLLAVFGLKAALLPLHFWLPHAYGAAAAPVAALFAIMTKVGAYAIVRVFTLVFGVEAGPLAGLADPWLLPVALASIALGTIGVLASDDLRRMTAYLVIASVGTLLAGIGLMTEAGLSGALYYLVHTTLVTGGLFLLADLVANGRRVGARITPRERPAGAGVLSVLFLLGAMAMIGMPPLSGLIGKLLILLAALPEPAVQWVWTVILISSAMLLIGLSRAGITLFWRGPPSPQAAPSALRLLPAAALIGSSPLLVIFGGPLTDLAAATAGQVLNPDRYVEAVLGAATVRETVGGAP